MSPTSSLLKRRHDARRRPTAHSKRRDHLRPDRNHAQKQRQRGQCGGFFNNGADHVTYPRTRTRSEHSSCYVLRQARSGEGLSIVANGPFDPKVCSCHNILRLSAKARCAETSGCLLQSLGLRRRRRRQSCCLTSPGVILRSNDSLAAASATASACSPSRTGIRLRTSSTALALSGSYARKLRTFPGFPSASKLVTRMFHPAAIAPLCAAAVAGRWRAVCSGLNPARPRARP